MNKKNKKILYYLTYAILLLIIFLQSTCYATDGINIQNSNELDNPLKVIIGVTEVIALGIASIMLIVVAIKYMVSSPNDRAEIKKHAIVYVVGAVIIFGATGIVEIIKNFATEVLQ